MTTHRHDTCNCLAPFVFGIVAALFVALWVREYRELETKPARECVCVEEAEGSTAR